MNWWRPALLLLFSLASVFGAVNAQPKHADRLRNVVDTLNGDLNVNTNIFIDYNHKGPGHSSGHHMSQLMRNITMPKFIVRGDPDRRTMLRMLDKFHTKILTIAFIDAEEDVPHLMDAVRRILFKLQHTDVLFVWCDGGGLPPRESLLHVLFERCWYDGFTNALLITETGLYTYHPFPQLQVLRLDGDTHAAKLAQYHNKEHMSDFQGHTLRSPVLNNAPRSYRYRDPKTGDIMLAGYMYRLLRQFIACHNGTFEEVQLRTNELILEDVLEAFAERQIDIVPCFMHMNRNYAHSSVQRIFNVLLMVPHARPYRPWLYFFLTLPQLMWLLLGLSIVVETAALIFTRRVFMGTWDCGGAFMRALGSLLYQPQSTQRPHSPGQRLLLVVLYFGGLLVSNFYLSMLSCLLTVKLFEPQLNTLADATATGLRIPQTEMDIAHLQQLSSLPPLVLARLQPAATEVVNGLIRNLSTRWLHADLDDRMLFFMHQQRNMRLPRVKLLDTVLYQVPGFMPVRQGSPFLPMLNVFLQRARETGHMNKILDNNEDEGIRSGEIRFFTDEYVPSISWGISWRHLWMIFTGLAVGLGLACVCFVGELLLPRRNRRQ